jgi:hypothetical protein
MIIQKQHENLTAIATTMTSMSFFPQLRTPTTTTKNYNKKNSNHDMLRKPNKARFAMVIAWGVVV